MIKYCTLCERKVEPKRKIGGGTFALALLTGGFWLLLIPFYSKKCPLCSGSSWGAPEGKSL